MDIQVFGFRSPTRSLNIGGNYQEVPRRFCGLASMGRRKSTRNTVYRFAAASLTWCVGARWFSPESNNRDESTNSRAEVQELSTVGAAGENAISRTGLDIARHLTLSRKEGVQKEVRADGKRREPGRTQFANRFSDVTFR